MKFSAFKHLKGFTLIELLIVIAILGVLASAVLIAINPLEQLARGRDAGRKSSVRQLGGAVQSYYTGQNSAYVTADNAWMTALQTAGELKTLPSNPTASGYTTGCFTATAVATSGGTSLGYCYQANATEAIVYARAESKSFVTTAGCNPTTQLTWIVWSSADGKTGVTCTGISADPSIGVVNLK